LLDTAGNLSSIVDSNLDNFDKIVIAATSSLDKLSQSNALDTDKMDEFVGILFGTLDSAQSIVSSVDRYQLLKYSFRLYL